MENEGRNRYGYQAGIDDVAKRLDEVKRRFNETTMDVLYLRLETSPETHQKAPMKCYLGSVRFRPALTGVHSADRIERSRPPQAARDDVASAGEEPYARKDGVATCKICIRVVDAAVTCSSVRARRPRNRKIPVTSHPILSHVTEGCSFTRTGSPSPGLP